MQIDPRQMKRMMQQMGIKTEEVPAKRVIIEKEDEKIILEDPSVTSIEQGGEKSYQISGGEVKIVPNIPEDDIKLVAEQSGSSDLDAAKALEESNGDVAEAILKLKKD